MTAGWATTAGALSVSIPVVLGPLPCRRGIRETHRRFGRCGGRIGKQIRECLCGFPHAGGHFRRPGQDPKMTAPEPTGSDSAPTDRGDGESFRAPEVGSQNDRGSGDGGLALAGQPGCLTDPDDRPLARRKSFRAPEVGSQHDRASGASFGGRAPFGAARISSSGRLGHPRAEEASSSAPRRPPDPFRSRWLIRSANHPPAAVGLAEVILGAQGRFPK